MRLIALSLVMLVSVAHAQPKGRPPEPRQHRPQGVPSCAFEKTYGSIEGSVSAGRETWIYLKLTSVTLASTQIETTAATEAYAYVRIQWAAGKEYAASGDFRVRGLPWPVGGKPAVKTFKHAVTAGTTVVSGTVPNALSAKAAELPLAFKAPKTGMVAFLRAGEAAGAITSVAVDAARAKRSLTLTAKVEGVGAALDELIKEADQRTAAWAAGRCK